MHTWSIERVVDNIRAPICQLLAFTLAPVLDIVYPPPTGAEALAEAEAEHEVWECPDQLAAEMRRVAASMGFTPPPLADWLMPAVMTVLANHEVLKEKTGTIHCIDSLTGRACGSFSDWQEWSQHVAHPVAARIAQVLPDYPGPKQ